MITIEKAYVHGIEFKTISGAGQKSRDLATLRVMVDRSYRDGESEDGTPRYNNDKDFWITVEMWGPRARALQGIVTKGARVIVVGRYENNVWTDRESGEARNRMLFAASQIAIDPGSIASIAYRSRSSEAAGAKDDPAEEPVSE